MEKNEQSGIPDPDVVMSTDVTGRRNIEMEKNEISRIPEPDVVVSPDVTGRRNTVKPPERVPAARRRNIEMEKNELSRIPDSDAVVSPDNPDDPNDPVGTTDDPNDPATDIVVSPDDPNDPVVTTDDPNSCALVTNTLKEIRAEQEKVNNDLESSFSSTSSIPDPNDPVVTTDDLNDPATDAARRRNKEMEKNKQSRMHDGMGNQYRMQLLKSFNDRPGPSQIKFKGRNNNDLESSSSKHEKHQPNDTKIEIKQLEEIMEAALSAIHVPVTQCCIYKVPKHLRKINEEVYTPQVISIGPFHHGKPELSEMENQKSIYIIEFREKVGEEKLTEFIRFIMENEQIIRDFYQENFTLTSPKFVNLILHDAVFIIEYFLNCAESKEKKKFDFFLNTPNMRAAITRDLQLLENQLPYFLLKNLFEQAAFDNYTKKEYPDHGDPFLRLSHRFFFDSENDVFFPEPNNEIQHFTDLRRYFLLMDFLPEDQNQGENLRDLPTATKLHASGVKFKAIEGGSSHKISCKLVPRFTCKLQISCFYSFQLSIQIPCLPIQIPYLTACELRIPCIEIDDWSECLYRNMMALELCHYPDKTHICNFILLMDFLINTDKDVDLLVEQGIIFSRLGDYANVATMFNNLNFQITPSHSVYHNICKNLKEHYGRRWNRTMATLNTVYFGDLWTGTATVAAFILLVLTCIQAVCSILSLL